MKLVSPYATSFQSCLQNCKHDRHLSECVSAQPHGKTQLPLDAFS